MNNYEDYQDIKQPPNSDSAEKAVIGGLIISPNRYADVSGIVEPEDFYYGINREIYQSIVTLADSMQSIDIITLADALDSRDMLDRVGGLPFLAEITDSITSAANIVSYATAVKDKSRQRSLILTGEKIVEMGYSSEMTTEEKISESQSCLLSMETHQGEEAAQANSAIKQVIADIDYRFNNPGVIGIQTGFKAIDEKIGGIRNQNLFIMAGRPAMGKTTLAMNIAEHNARSDVPVLVFSAEMSREELMERMISSAGGLSFSKVRSGQLEESGGDWPKLTAGITALKDRPLYIDDRGGLSISQIQSTARKQKQRNDIKLIIVDYLQLLSGKGQSREQEVSTISRGLKALAKELDIPVIAVSQLSRKCEERSNKRPMSSDLRDSGAIEQDADIIAFIYRDEVYDENSEHKGIAELIFTKARNFQTGTVMLASRLDICKFDTLSYEPPPLQDAKTKGGGFNYE